MSKCVQAQMPSDAKEDVGGPEIGGQAIEY